MPLTGGTVDGLININGASIKISDPNNDVDSYLSMEHGGSGNSGPIIRFVWSEDVQTYINAYGMDVNMSHYGSEGVSIKDKTTSDLLHAAGGTVSINDIISQVTVPTKVSELTNDSGYQTEAQVAAKVASLVDSAPETLDTLNELAAAIGDDPNFATTVTNQIAQKADKTTATTSTAGLMSATDKDRIDKLYTSLSNFGPITHVLDNNAFT